MMFETQRRVLLLVGVNTWRERQAWGLVVSLTGLALWALLTGAKFWRGGDQLTERAVTLIFSINFVSGGVKMWSVSRPEVKRAGDLLESLPPGPLTGLVSLLTRAYYSSVVILVIIMYTSPLFSPEYRLPYPFWWPLPYDTFVPYFCVYLMSLPPILTCAVTHAAVDTLFLAMGSQICTCFSQIHRRLQAFRPSTTNEEFRFVLDEYKQALSSSKLFNRMLEFIFLVQIFCSTLGTCLVFYLLNTANNSSDTIKFIPMLSSMYLQLLMYCWMGQYVTDYMEEVHRSVYMTCWYDLPLEMRKALLLTLKRTSKPAPLVAGVFTISRATFLAVVRESLSYYMFLRTMTN